MGEDVLGGVEANGLPLNPVWFPQTKTPGTKINFQVCDPAFLQDGSSDYSVLAELCSTDAPTEDIAKIVSFIPGVCPHDPIAGHLNWGVVTYTGTLTWQGWAGDTEPGMTVTTPSGSVCRKCWTRRWNPNEGAWPTS